MLISFFGIDGCGKGTQIEALMRFLREQGLSPFYSKAYAEAEKEQFSGFMPHWSPWARMFAFQAFHTHQCDECVKALARGEIVCADRWDESYLVYHGAHPDSPISSLEMRGLYTQLNSIAFQNIVPDISILLDVDTSSALERTAIRGQDFFDLKGIQYHEFMRQGFLKLAAERGAYVLDASRNWGEVHNEVREIVVGKLTTR